MAGKIRKEDGAGGKYMQDFLRNFILSRFSGGAGEVKLEDLEDGSDFPGNSGGILTTDSYVVTPPIFRGGSIGSLAICGTCNDLAVMGAEPKALSMSLVIQDGFEIQALEKILDDMKYWCDQVGVRIITGDTKVVESGVGIIVNTSGVGFRNEWLEKNLEVVREYREYPYSWVRDRGLRDGDAIIVSGTIAEHGVAVMLEREEFGFEMDVCSDVYPVWLFLKDVLGTGGVTAMKDPTRGGIAGVLNEMAEKSGVGILIEEEKVPVRDDVRGFCEALGLDPMSMACEGRVVMGVVGDMVDDVLKALKKAGQKNAEVIGYSTSEFREVVVETPIGSRKILPPPVADPVPRVC